ncbi:MAG: phage holin family protein [Burkholderiaceae bacterium]|jgi:uncharacterized membrane protein YqjE|nr:phage holin family protein [Burkholderiaceae bacterium]
MSSNPENSSASAAARVRLLLTDLIDLLAVRLDLLVIEAQLEMRRLTWLLVLGVLGVVLLGFGIVFLAAFITMLLWDSHRDLALAVFTTLFLCGGAALLLLAWARLKQGARMFAATRAELQADKERMRP